MNDYIIRELAKMRRVVLFGEEHPLDPENPAATTEYVGVANAIFRIESFGEDQAAGKGTVSGAVSQRLVYVDDLLSLMSSLAKAANVLDASTHPDVASKMRMGGIKNFEQLITRAKLFRSTLQSIEAEFITLGASPTVAADLQGKINKVQGAWDLKLSGRDLHIGGTAGLMVAVREGLKHVRKLDAILCQIYRTDAVLLSQWKAARRTERAHKVAGQPTETSDTGNLSGAVAPVPAEVLEQTSAVPLNRTEFFYGVGPTISLAVPPASYEPERRSPSFADQIHRR